LQSPASSDGISAQTNSINDESGILASLFGSEAAREEFFRLDFDKHLVHMKRSTASKNGDLLTDSNMLPPPLSGIDMKSLYESSDYISLRIRGSHDMLDKEKMSYDDFTKYINSGGSATVPIIDTDYMYPFRLQIEEALGQEVSMNVYHSGPSAVALNRHYDSYDVFVLQLEGSKEWMLQEDGEREKIRSITTWSNATMASGDVMYIPQGIFHAATTAQKFDRSTHVTIGLVN
jgi:hypothetical protein